MEQDCVAGVYQCLGLSLGAEFSSEDVSVLYGKVFHVPSDAGEAHAALKKAAGGDASWSCVGGNILDVLVEMERDRENKEKLYWDLQLIDGRKDTKTLMKADKGSHTGSCYYPTKTQRLVEKEERRRGSRRGARRLRKAARHSWIRLASEGVQSMLPSPWHAQSPKAKGQAWGCVSLSDVLLLVDVKYDAVSHLLYSEMLQEHHTPSVWDAMLPSQRQSEEEGLEDVAEEALESGDLLRLAELPGAFRMYRARLGASLNSRELCWSAASFLCELHTTHQQEKDKVAVLGERLDWESRKLLCLHIHLATLRARREELSYRALLAAKQSWDTWPHVGSPCRAQQAALWLRHEEEAENDERAPGSPQQQAALQLLVLSQEQERKQLVRMVHGVSLEDLQGPVCTAPPEDGRNKLIKLLRQIHASMQGRADAGAQPRPHTRAQECSLLLVTRLLELQDLRASAFLSLLNNKSARHLEREDESELPTTTSADLLELLASDAASILPPDIHSEPQTAEHDRAGPAEVSAAVPVREVDREVNEVPAAGVTNTQDVCTDCGAVVEEMPYLEIVCTAQGGRQEEDGGSASRSPQTYEKQGSLITLAWSKPPEDDEDEDDREAAAAERGQDCESSMRIQVLLNDVSKAAEYTQCGETSGEHHDEKPKPALPPAMGQPDEEGDGSEYNLQTQALAAEPQQHVEHPDDLDSGPSHEAAEVGREVDPRGPDPTPTEEQTCDSQLDCGLAEGGARREATLTERERAREPVSALERERTIRSLVDTQRKVEQRQQRDRERQLLRVQERLSIVQSRKAEEDLLGLKHTDRLRHLTQDLPQEDKNQQKTVVRERLEQLRRERSYVLQSKRDRNTAGFKELLAPVALDSKETEDGAD